jgi:hypothetical protein
MAVLLVARFASSLQAQPDLAGRWTLDTPSPPPDAARVLVIEQPVTRNNVRGEAMSPTYLHVSVRRERRSGATTDTYTIGTIGGVVGGISRNRTRIAPPSTYFEIVFGSN